MRSPVYASVVLLLLVGCQLIPPLVGPDDRRNSDRVPVHTRVDDEVIDQGDPYSVIEPVWWTADIYHGEAEYNKSLAGFTREQRLVYAVVWYFYEVENGGHDQFYYNSTGIVWKYALDGFREMGVDEAAAILEESAKRMGGNPSLERKTRWEQMDTFQPEFGDLDERLYDLDDRIHLYGIMQDYIKKHRNAFYFEGQVKKPKSLVK
jgi:hypothetical protein